MRISDAFSQQSVLKVRFPYPIVVVVVVGFHHEMMVDLVKARHRKRNATHQLGSAALAHSRTLLPIACGHHAPPPVGPGWQGSFSLHGVGPGPNGSNGSSSSSSSSASLYVHIEGI